MSIDIIKQQTKDLIDRLKSTTNNIGLGNSGNEYTVIVETFLYKFLNDKFIYEAKRTLPELADAEDVYEALERLPDEEYEEMCDMMLDTIVLKKEHLIPYLAKRQNEDNFATLFDATLEAIADTNEEIFYILNEDETRISIMKPLSEVVTGGSAKKNGFCKSLIGDVASFLLKRLLLPDMISSPPSLNTLLRTTIPMVAATMPNTIRPMQSHPLWRNYSSMRARMLKV